MADSPKLKTYAEGEAIPSVDSEDIKRFWHVKPPWRSGNDVQSACSPAADTAAVFRRWTMIRMIYELLTPWQHGDELDDAVFQVAATFPLRELKHRPYMIPGDEHFGFDPNAFVQRLIEETGISHVWEPVATKVAEAGGHFPIHWWEGRGNGTQMLRPSTGRGKYCGRCGSGLRRVWTRWCLTAIRNTPPR